MTLKEIESRYHITLPPLYHRLHEAGMLDWLGGRSEPLPEGFDWAKEVYPALHENPPLLFHTGGDLFIMTPKQIVECACPDYWQSDTHTLVPFARGIDEALHFVLIYKTGSEAEPMVGFVFEDEEETQLLAKNFEDFIFRTMVEAADEIDRENLDREYGQNAPESYRADILRDLETIRPWLKSEYGDALDDLYHGAVGETLVSYYFQGSRTAEELIAEMIEFEGMDEEIELT